ncbi:MAG: hypothetical protein ACREQO_03660 [Candidatus Binatia bacterium]
MQAIQAGELRGQLFRFHSELLDFNDAMADYTRLTFGSKDAQEK